jgi:acetyltransferase-like isoleucine patch superfamily enzyme
MKDLINKFRTLWYITKYQYILKSATFGPKITIKCKLSIVGPGKVIVGSGCRFESDPWGDDYVTLYTHRPKANIIIGNNVILRAARFGSHLSITVEDNAVLEYSSIFDSDFHNLDATKRDEDFNEGDRPVIIGEGSYVGCECLCSKGTILGKNVTLLPSTVIGTKKVPDSRFVCGNPARIMKRRI